MNLINKYEPILKEFKNNSNILAIIIFGSYSKNNIKPMSDLDLALILKSNLNNKKKIIF